MANDVNRLIDMLYERIEDAKSPALKPNMSMVDRDELLDLLDELRAQLPVEIKRAQELLDMVGLGDRAEAFPAQLSGGQKQRVAIARMLISGAPVMVFDDSLSAVDSETDAKIRAALRESLAKATVILISHRITTLMQADRILVLENGRVSDIGTHEELISRPGIYREIYDIQMSSDDRRLIEEGGGAHAGI